MRGGIDERIVPGVDSSVILESDSYRDAHDAGELTDLYRRRDGCFSGTDAKFPALVISPRVDGSVVLQGEYRLGEAASDDVHDAGEAAHLFRPVCIDICSVAELAKRVSPPRIECPVIFHSERQSIPRGNLHDAREAGHFFG